MKLHVQTDFSADPKTVWDVFEGDDFDRRLEQVTSVSRTTLDERPEGDVVVRRVKCVSKRDLPGFMARALGTKQLTYTQINRLDVAKTSMSWVVELPVLRDKVKVSGTTVIVATPSGSRRTVSGDVSVRIPLVGGRIEKTIVAEFERSYAGAAQIARELLSAR